MDKLHHFMYEGGDTSSSITSLSSLGDSSSASDRSQGLGPQFQSLGPRFSRLATLYQEEEGEELEEESSMSSYGSSQRKGSTEEYASRIEEQIGYESWV